jgi:hypothetical protein
LTTRNIHLLIDFYFFVRFARCFLPLVENIALTLTIYHAYFYYENCLASPRLNLTPDGRSPVADVEGFSIVNNCYISSRFAGSFLPLLDENVLICLTYHIDICYENLLASARLNKHYLRSFYPHLPRTFSRIFPNRQLEPVHIYYGEFFSNVSVTHKSRAWPCNPNPFLNPKGHTQVEQRSNTGQTQVMQVKRRTNTGQTEVIR